MKTLFSNLNFTTTETPNLLWSLWRKVGVGDAPTAPLPSLHSASFTTRLQALSQIPLHQFIESLTHHYQTTLPEHLQDLVTQTDNDTPLTSPFDDQGQLIPSLAETLTGQEYLETERLLHYLAWLDDHWPQVLQGLGLTLAAGGGGLYLRHLHRRGWWGKVRHRLTRQPQPSPSTVTPPAQPPNPTTPFLHDLAHSGQTLVTLKIDTDFEADYADLFTWSGPLSWDNSKDTFIVAAREGAITFEPGAVKAASLSINDTGQTETIILLQPAFSVGDKMAGHKEVANETL
jgi:hypothetical protein